MLKNKQRLEESLTNSQYWNH